MKRFTAMILALLLLLLCACGGTPTVQKSAVPAELTADTARPANAGEKIWLDVYYNASCTVTNAEGETLTIENGEAAGEIKVYQTAVEGYDVSPTFRCLVPYSSYFIFESADEVSRFMVAWDDSFFRDLDVSGARMAVLSVGGIYAEGEDMTYALCCNSADRSSLFCYMLGSGETKFSALMQDGQALLNGGSPYQAAINDHSVSSEPTAYLAVCTAEEGGESTLQLPSAEDTVEPLPTDDAGCLSFRRAHSEALRKLGATVEETQE